MWEFLICYFYLIFTVFIWNKCCLFFIDTDTEAKSLKITTGSSIAMFWGSFVWPSSKAWHEASLIDTYLDFTPDPKYIYKKERSRERKTITFLYLSHQQRRGPFLILSSRHGHFESDKQCKARCSHWSCVMKLLGWTWPPYKILVKSTSAQINKSILWEAQSPVEVGLWFTKGLSDLSSALLTHRSWW